MVERSDLERFRTANAELSRMVKEALEAFFASLDLARPEAARDSLLEFTPVLVAQYGEVAAALAADWYEELTGSTGAALARSVDAATVASQVRYAAGHLWTPQPAAALGVLSVQVDKFVKQPGRDTIASNARRGRVRWARVPTGSKTCAWCLTLASRDAVYLSERSASKAADGSDYHGDCDCVPTPLGSRDDYPEGYDPDEYYRMYQVARDQAGSGDIKEIAAAMRRSFPDHVRDGVVEH
ncbi:hypothetical protein G9E11_01910 [Arthrobacter sp. IA7]|uniref:VG15 protein n=1 Tax=Arthrobacter ipis TaxID=2716202 RepID=UPI0016860954|nr:hypothetical protein [Arthrobacter ipis]MBD1541029.1 hypothetical protein [Arthrobacter ipis]